MPLFGRKFRKYPIFGKNPEISPFWAKTSKIPHFGRKCPFWAKISKINHFGRKCRILGENAPFGAKILKTPDFELECPFWAKISKIPHSGRNCPLFSKKPLFWAKYPFWVENFENIFSSPKLLFISLIHFTTYSHRSIHSSVYLIISSTSWLSIHYRRLLRASLDQP